MCKCELKLSRAPNVCGITMIRTLAPNLTFIHCCITAAPSAGNGDASYDSYTKGTSTLTRTANLVPGVTRESLVREDLEDRPEETQSWQIVAILRQIEVAVANHNPTQQACREAGITERSSYHWRKYGGLKLEQARRLKTLEKENSRPRRRVTELSLEKQERIFPNCSHYSPAKGCGRRPPCVFGEFCPLL